MGNAHSEGQVQNLTAFLARGGVVVPGSSHHGQPMSVPLANNLSLKLIVVSHPTIHIYIVEVDDDIHMSYFGPPIIE